MKTLLVLILVGAITFRLNLESQKFQLSDTVITMDNLEQWMAEPTVVASRSRAAIRRSPHGHGPPPQPAPAG